MGKEFSMTEKDEEQRNQNEVLPCTIDSRMVMRVFGSLERLGFLSLTQLNSAQKQCCPDNLAKWKNLHYKTIQSKEMIASQLTREWTRERPIGFVLDWPFALALDLDAPLKFNHLVIFLC